MKQRILLGPVALLAVAVLATAQEGLTARLTKALAAEDLAAVRACVAELRQALGERAGAVEGAEKYLPIPKDATWLEPAEAHKAFEPLLARIPRAQWWKIGLDPAKLDRPLREPATVLSGCAHALRSQLDGKAACLAAGKQAADFLIWAQEQAGTGVIPFPVPGAQAASASFAAAQKMLARAKAENLLEQVVRNGWIVDDLGEGGLQYDTGEGGVALFEWYAETGDRKYLKAATRAADWALARPMVSNWNYNSFSVYLLAQAYQATKEEKYLDCAYKKARIGVLPGQLTEGPLAGRWLDAHNAHPEYHFIILRALAHLHAALPEGDARRAEIKDALELGLRARNQDFLDKGAPNKEMAMETLPFVAVTFAEDKAFLNRSRTHEALDALGKLVSSEARNGKLPLGPRSWSLFLEYVTRKSKR